jgi:hypothetical protein
MTAFAEKTSLKTSGTAVLVHGGNKMPEMIASKNKALVLAAFDTLFTTRDYAAAERFWSPHDIQHSAHIEPGRNGLFSLINPTATLIGKSFNFNEI